MVAYSCNARWARHGGLPPGPSEDQCRLLLKLQPPHALGVAANQGAHCAVRSPGALTAEMPVAQHAVERSQQP
eukprot:6942995-Pyramimonas_sp.AAC.1